MTGQDRGYQYQAEFNLIPQGMVARETACNEGFQNILNKYWHPRVAILNVR